MQARPSMSVCQCLPVQIRPIQVRPRYAPPTSAFGRSAPFLFLEPFLSFPITTSIWSVRNKWTVRISERIVRCEKLVQSMCFDRSNFQQKRLATADRIHEYIRSQLYVELNKIVNNCAQLYTFDDWCLYFNGVGGWALWIA
jgi:hypothetical protein